LSIKKVLAKTIFELYYVFKSAAYILYMNASSTKTFMKTTVIHVLSP